jgi:hypothetical protein
MEHILRRVVGCILEGEKEGGQNDDEQGPITHTFSVVSRIYQLKWSYELARIHKTSMRLTSIPNFKYLLRAERRAVHECIAVNMKWRD